MKNPFIKTLLILLSVFSFSFESKAQIDSASMDSLRRYEHKLQGLGDSIINSTNQKERMLATYYFARTLIQALKQPHSFDYAFDSVKFVSIIKPKDEKFRIFTWSLKYNEDTFKYGKDSFEFYGAIQMNTKDDKLTLFGLYDSSSRMGMPEAEYEEVNAKFWYGALYYSIIEKKYKKKKYYTLLGWDGHTSFSNRKIVDVLSFDEEEKPVFGAPMFVMEDKKPPKYRIIYEFRNDAAMTLRYVKQKDIIVMEHLIPPDKLSEGMYNTYLPDGSYDYMVFKKGKWVKKENLFDHYKNVPTD